MSSHSHAAAITESKIGLSPLDPRPEMAIILKVIDEQQTRRIVVPDNASEVLRLFVIDIVIEGLLGKEYPRPDKISNDYDSMDRAPIQFLRRKWYFNTEIIVNFNEAFMRGCFFAV
ncbi:Ff.00g064650.m01.CDS01 [Fusarium sp. VM40]|nr:Ff.00g064650.m01.CDS01 [Fusarium sp. VM40]